VVPSSLTSLRTTSQLEYFAACDSLSTQSNPYFNDFFSLSFVTCPFFETLFQTVYRPFLLQKVSSFLIETLRVSTVDLKHFASYCHVVRSCVLLSQSAFRRGNTFELSTLLITIACFFKSCNSSCN